MTPLSHLNQRASHPAVPGDAQRSQENLQDQLSLDPDTRTALEAFHIRILNRFGERLRGLVLFGSRARGDHRPDSDADVAVFLDRIDDPVAAQMDIAEDSYAVFLTHELFIEPWVFRGAPEHPDRSRAAHLLDAVEAEGIKV